MFATYEIFFGSIISGLLDQSRVFVPSCAHVSIRSKSEHIYLPLSSHKFQFLTRLNVIPTRAFILQASPNFLGCLDAYIQYISKQPTQETSVSLGLTWSLPVGSFCWVSQYFLCFDACKLDMPQDQLRGFSQWIGRAPRPSRSSSSRVPATTSQSPSSPRVPSVPPGSLPFLPNWLKNVPHKSLFSNIYSHKHLHCTIEKKYWDNS